MFTVFFVNFCYAAGGQFKTLEEALTYAARRGFEASILLDGCEVVAAWHPIRGRWICRSNKGQ